MGKRTKEVAGNIHAIFWRTEGGPFVVTRFDDTRGKSVRYGKKVYETVGEALAVAIRDDKRSRYPLLVDFASAIPA